LSRFRFIIWSLILSFGLTGCIQSQLRAGYIEEDPRPVPLSNNPEILPSSTPITAPSPIPTLTSSPTLVVPSRTPEVCRSENGSIEIKQLPTSWLSTPLGYRVYTPPCYDLDLDQRYPVLYLIHGYGYNDDQWDRLGADEITGKLIFAGEISPFIIVMPNESNQNSQPPKNHFGEALVYDLVPEIDASYRTIPFREYRAIGGLSRGGNWALHLGLTQWTVFGAIGAHSAPIFISDDPKIQEWLSEIPPDKYPRIYMDVGEKDKWFDQIIRFEELLDQLNVPHELFSFPGGHTEEYWAAHTEQYIRWYAADW
jgi:enterochelin esterase-like enzyme